MQDVDFGRMYKYKRSSSRQDPQFPAAKFQQKLGVVVFFAFLFFVLGIFTGIQFERYQSRSSDTSDALSFAEQTSANVGSEDIDPRINISADLSHEEEQLDKDIAESSAAALVSQEEKPDIRKALKSEQPSFLILARIYDDKARAYYNGSVLQQKGLPVFLAESGKRMKVYVGPVKGKNAAYGMLAKVKKVPEFNGAIMYKK